MAYRTDQVVLYTDGKLKSRKVKDLVQNHIILNFVHVLLLICINSIKNFRAGIFLISGNTRIHKK